MKPIVSISWNVLSGRSVESREEIRAKKADEHPFIIPDIGSSGHTRFDSFFGRSIYASAGTKREFP